MTFEEYAKFVSTYTLEYTTKLSGVPANRLKALAELYADPKSKVVSFWTMGFNQHTRGVWANNMVYNIHLLTGKIATPGNSPFSLTGQPSACGTAREVGTFSHRLPADMVVTNPSTAPAEEIWKLPEGTIPDKPGYHAVLQNRMLKDGKLNAYWVRSTTTCRPAPTWPRKATRATAIPTTSWWSRTPTHRHGRGRRPDPAHRHVGEKEGAYGNAERRTQFWHQLVKAPGEARSDLWQLMEFSKRFKVEEVWPEELLAKKPAAARPCSTCCTATARWTSSRSRTWTRPTTTRIGLRLLRAKGPVRGIRRLRPWPWPRSGAFDQYHKVRGLRWPVVNGKETRWRYREGSDPYVKAGTGFQFYGNPDGKANIFALPYEPPPRLRTRSSVLAVHRPRAGALALRIDDPPRARAAPCVPNALCYMHPRTPRRWAAPRQRVELVSRRGAPCARVETRGRNKAARIGLCALVRRQPADQQGDAGCDRPDFVADGLQEVRCQGHQGLTKGG
jgi:nitrate reductase NapA